VPASLRFLRIANASVGDDVGCFSLGAVCYETRSVHEISKSLVNGRATYPANLVSWLPAHRHALCGAGHELSRRARGRGHRLACGRQHRRRGRWHQDRFELGWSVWQNPISEASSQAMRLAYHENANVELLGHVSELRQELVEFLLTIGKLAAATVVNAEAGHDAVDDEETVFVA